MCVNTGVHVPSEDKLFFTSTVGLRHRNEGVRLTQQDLLPTEPSAGPSNSYLLPSELHCVGDTPASPCRVAGVAGETV